jgi:peptide/nickel transport system permease protein
MSLFLFKRLITLIATLIGASVIVFLVLEILPGNAAQMLMGPDASPEAVAGPGHQARPRPARRWSATGTGSAACSPATWATATPTARRCSDLILERLAPHRAARADGDGAHRRASRCGRRDAAARHNKLGDVGLMGLSQVGIAIPNFWFAILLILVFSVQLQWFSAGGFPGWERRHLRGIALLLPACRWPWCRPPSSRASRARPCSK